jgi:hypothetical protein
MYNEDEAERVLCRIVETRYLVKDKYKVTLSPEQYFLAGPFGVESIYQMDMDTAIDQDPTSYVFYIATPDGYFPVSL